MHYETCKNALFQENNLLKFSSGHIHLILGPILKTWVLFYSLEYKEFENHFIISVF